MSCKKTAIRAVELFVILVGLLAVATDALAGSSEDALNLTLLRTYIRTQNDTLSINNNPVQAFLPTVVTCPTTVPNGCTLRIEVSSVFQNVSSINTGVSVELIVTGSNLPGVDPDATLQACPDCGDDMRTFQWMQRDVPSGTQVTVNVEFYLPLNIGGQAVDRTETVELFRN